MDTVFIVKFFGALFAIMNPFTGLPVFLSLTEGETPAAQRALALKVASYIAILGVLTALAGQKVLALFGIGIHHLQVAGGLVVLGIAFTMLNGAPNDMHHGSAAERSSVEPDAAIAFYPLAFPLMLGPGTITTLILFAGQARTPADWVGYFCAFAAVVLLVALVFGAGSSLGARISATARVIMTRLMGLILAAIAIEMIFEGAVALAPGLGG